MVIDNEEHLEHHGVKGMHWGVRSNRSSTKSSSPKKKRPPSSTSHKVGLAFTGALLAAQGALTLAAIKIR